MQVFFQEFELRSPNIGFRFSFNALIPMCELILTISRAAHPNNMYPFRKEVSVSPPVGNFDDRGNLNRRTPDRFQNTPDGLFKAPNAMRQARIQCCECNLAVDSEEKLKVGL